MSLPSGLGAGGRGKEKQPCRYLHYEVDWDERDVDTSRATQKGKKRPYRIGIGMGPNGKDVPVVSISLARHIFICYADTANSYHPNGSTATSGDLTTLYWGSSTS